MSGTVADRERDQTGPKRPGWVSSQSLADRDAAYSPTVSRHDALANHIANSDVAVIGIGSVVISETQTESKPRTAKTTMMDAAAAETAALAAAAMAKGGCGRRSQ